MSGLNSFRYSLRMAVTLPALPVLMRQGKRIRQSVPKLPEAKQPCGNTGQGTTTIRLLALGESTIAGIGVDQHSHGFTGTLADSLASQYDASVDWQVYAKSGYTAKMLHQRILPKITESHTDLIVIGLGGNDSFRLTPPWKWRKHILQIIDTLQARFQDTPVVFINMPPVREFPAFTSLIRSVAGSHTELLGNELEQVVKPIPNVHFIAERITLATWRNKLNYRGDTPVFFSDGVHPSALTYQIWARETAQFIHQNDVI